MARCWLCPNTLFLWSGADEFARHQRRYCRGELERKCRAAGFDVVFSTSFVSCLLPLMTAQRLLWQPKGQGTIGDGAMHPALDRTLEAGTELDRFLIKFGVRLPAGGSRFVVLRR